MAETKGRIMSVTFSDVYEKLCERYPDPGERGRQFERLIVQVLRTDRAFRRRFSKVWHWGEWPGRDGGDFYADIVAERTDGGLAAIQVKCFDPGHVISASDLTSFLAITQKGVTERIVITTSAKWGRNAVRTLLQQQPPVQRFDCFALVDGGTIDWDPYLADANAALRPTPRKQLRDHQKEALDDVVAGLRDHDRGKLIMGCGTGKTLTALHSAEPVAGANGQVLVCAPSISLLPQVMGEWTVEAKRLGQPFVAELTKLGWQIETETAREVLIVKVHRVDHLLRLLLSVFTHRLWLVVWHLVDVLRGARRRAFTKPQENVVDVDPIKPKRLATDAVDRLHQQLKPEVS